MKNLGHVVLNTGWSGRIPPAVNGTEDIVPLRKPATFVMMVKVCHHDRLPHGLEVDKGAQLWGDLDEGELEVVIAIVRHDGL